MMNWKQTAAALTAAVCMLGGGSLAAGAAEGLLGDLNGDKLINASDAAILLSASATEGATGVSPLDTAGKAAADVNQDGLCNASDAALILQYAAAVGVGYAGSLESFLERPQQPQAPRAYYTPLTCLNAHSELAYNCPDSEALPDGRLLLNYYYEENDAIRSRVILVDAVQDKIIKELDSGTACDIAAVLEDGIVLLYSDENIYRFYDLELNETRSFDLPYYSGVFSEDGQYFYGIINGLLYRIDTTDRSAWRIPTPECVTFEDFLPDQHIRDNTLYLSSTYWDEDNSFGLAVVDVESGDLLMLDTGYQYPMYCGDSVVFPTIHMRKPVYLYRTADGAAWTRCELPEGACAIQVGETPYLLLQTTEGPLIALYDEDGSLCTAAPDYADILLYSADTTGIEDPAVVLMDTQGIPGTDLMLTISAVDDAQSLDENGMVSGEAVLCYGVLDMAQAAFGQTIPCEPADPVMQCDPEIVRYFEAASVKPTVREDLQPLRDYADRLESEYDVEIYLSDECGEAFYCGTTTFLKTSERYTDHETEYAYIELALQELERALAKYPEGYFRQFRDLVGTGGVSIAMVSTITDESIDSAAYEFSERKHDYRVAMDVDYGVEMNAGHELWHCTEDFINDQGCALLKDETWSELNPGDFVYSTYAGYDTVTETYTFLWEPDENVYFYDTYAKTTSYEDKARIMEHIMTPGEGDALFLAKPRIQDKLRRMCEAMREVFDTTGWENAPWEQRLAS